MRSLTAGEIAALSAAHRVPYRRLEVESATAGVYNDLTTQLESGETSTSVDRTVIEARFRLRRPSASGSLSPLVTDALAPGRSVRLYHATVAAGAPAPASGDYHLIFDGEIDRVDAGSDPVEIVCRDSVGAFIADRDIKFEVTYPAGTSLDALIAAAINPFFPIDGAVAPTLEIPVATGVSISADVKLEASKMLESVRDSAQRIGWTIRPVWSDTAGEFVLRLYEPPRNSATVAWTYNRDRYRLIPALVQDRSSIVNHVWVTYPDTDRGSRFTVTSEDTASATQYGERWAQITEADGSPIATEALAQQMADALISDLAEPSVEADVVVPYNPFLDIDDRITVEASPLTHGTDQTLAIVGYSHRFGPGMEQSTLQVRGKPTGGIRRWKQVEPPDTTDAYSILSFDPYGASADATELTYRAVCGGYVDEVWAYQVTLDADNMLADPHGYAEDNTLGLQVLTPTLDNLQRAVDVTYTVPPEGRRLYILLRPYRVLDNGQYVPGPAWNAHIDPLPAQPPVIDQDDTETATTGYFWINVQKRGIDYTSVRMVTQAGRNGPVFHAAATRTEGDTSVVTGEVMGADEFEGEVTLSPDGPSFIVFYITLAGGESLPVYSSAFNTNGVPFFTINPYSDGVSIMAAGANTRSIKVERVDGGGTWVVERDGASIAVSVLGADDSSNAGLADNTTGIYRTTLRSEPTADLDGTELTATGADVSVTRGSPVGTNSIDSFSATAPSAGSDSIGYTLDCDNTTGDVLIQWRYRADGGAWGSWTLAATHTTPPTTATAYSFASGLTRAGKPDPGDPPIELVDVEVKAEIVDGILFYDSATASISYYSEGA